MTSNELKKLRERLGLTQAELAKRLDVSVRTVIRWEQGKIEISQAVALALKHIVAEES